MANATTVCNRVIYRDHSNGQGHCWRIDAEIPASIREEIEGEIIDGGRESCRDFVASNGQHYRW